MGTQHSSKLNQPHGREKGVQSQPLLPCAAAGETVEVVPMERLQNYCMFI